MARSSARRCRRSIAKVHQVTGSSGCSVCRSMSCLSGRGRSAGTSWRRSGIAALWRSTTGSGLTRSDRSLSSAIFLANLVLDFYQIQHLDNNDGNRWSVVFGSSFVSSDSCHCFSHHFEGSLCGLCGSFGTDGAAAARFGGEQEFSQIVLRSFFHWEFCVAVLDIPPAEASVSASSLVFHHDSVMVSFRSQVTQGVGSNTVLLDRVQCCTPAVRHVEAIEKTFVVIGFRIDDFIQN
mmetsp:Transcript_12121/g.30684  ORF Transcript_12121/g.30684 Transcript_12121/m.30684 type:complete len:236 (-) Transcript_12121:258-965(-)